MRSFSGQKNQANTIGRANQRPSRSSGSKHWFFIHYLTATPAASQIDEPIDSEASGVAKIRRLEAALFLSKEGISSRKLAKLAGLADATEARTLIRQLNQEYDDQGRAYRVEEIAGGYAILTRSQFATWLRRVGYVPGERRLSQSAMETLAIVAYRQPVLRAEVEAIRGVGCSEVLKQLMELELVRISGRSEDLGRPYLYGTTRRFLQMFGLRSVDRLPRMSWVNEPAAIPLVESTIQQSETEDSAMTLTTKSAGTDLPIEDPASAAEASVATVLLMEEGTKSVRASEDDEDEFYDDDDDDGEEDYDEDDYGDEEDGEWEDDEDEESSDEDDDVDEESEWEEVDDDDDGWVDEDDEVEEEDEEDDWGDDDGDGEDDDWD